jgi:predicted transposase YdaD
LELKVQVRNINKGHSVEIVDQSPLLRDYVAFVEEVREVNKEEGMTPEQAMERAIENCIKKGILINFLNQHKLEVMKMLVTEWDYDLEKEVLKEEAHEKGLSQGLSRGREEERHKNIRDFYRIGVGIQTIAKAVDLSEQEVKKILGL